MYLYRTENSTVLFLSKCIIYFEHIYCTLTYIPTFFLPAPFPFLPNSILSIFYKYFWIFIKQCIKPPPTWIFFHSYLLNISSHKFLHYLLVRTNWTRRREMVVWSLSPTVSMTVYWLMILLAHSDWETFEPALLGSCKYWQDTLLGT